MPTRNQPNRQESDRCRRDIVCRQRCAITKSDFHVGRWQWSSKHLCDATICAVGSDQKRARPLEPVSLITRQPFSFVLSF
jgi:hypothetical protein